MSISSHSRRSSSHSSSHSSRSTKEKKLKCARPTNYLLRSRSCSQSRRSRDSKEHHRNHDRGRDRGREPRHSRRSNSRSPNSRSRSRSQSYSPGDRRRGHHHHHDRSPSRTPSQRDYRSSRSRSRSSYYSSVGRRSSRSYHRRDRHWSRSRDRYYSKGPGGYHPPYPPYNGRGGHPHAVAMIPLHPGNGNPGYRDYPHPHGPYGTSYGTQYAGTGAYHPGHPHQSHHGDAPPPHGAATQGYYGGGGSRDRDKGPPQLHKRRHDGPPGVSLLIRHIAPTISTQHLFQVFTQKLPHLIPPRDIYIPRDFHSHQPKGFAFVEYSSFEQAQEARSEMDKMVLHGKGIEVVFAQDKRKTPLQMRDRHLDDAYGGGDASKGGHGHESSSSFERHKRKEKQKERRERGGGEENSKGSSPWRSNGG